MGVITLNEKELKRVEVFSQCIDGHITQVQAAQRLDLGYRQVKRLIAQFRQQGAAALVSKRRGRVSNRKLSQKTKQKALDLVKELYPDFGPTFAAQKLAQSHNLHICIATLRRWMMQEGLWNANERKLPAVHQIRPRRSQFGELIQIDGSYHRWFEERAPMCTLLVFIDDATSRLVYLQFVPSESTQTYMQALKAHLATYGRPVAYYSDKHGVFRVNNPGREEKYTQFGRALRALDIELIYAHSPQAKGRVERANKTLQNRLVKEMRLLNICSLEEANAFLPRFIEEYNQMFSVAPSSSIDAHREVLKSPQEMETVFSNHYTHKVYRNLTLRFENTVYQIISHHHASSLRGAWITVCKDEKGEVELLYKGERLAYIPWKQEEVFDCIADSKTIHSTIDLAKKKQKRKTGWKPAEDHPWREYQNKSSEQALHGN